MEKKIENLGRLAPSLSMLIMLCRGKKYRKLPMYDVWKRVTGRQSATTCSYYQEPSLTSPN